MVSQACSEIVNADAIVAAVSACRRDPDCTRFPICYSFAVTTLTVASCCAVNRPIAKTGGNQDLTTGIAQAASTNPAPAGGGRTILVVDDDPVFRAVMEVMLRREGAREVILASDGEVGSRILAERNAGIDVVTLDLSMPRLDGVGFLRKAGAIGFAGRLILISGEHSSVLQSAARLAKLCKIDCSDTFSKPVDFARIAERAVRGSQQRETRPPMPPVNLEEINSALANSRLFAYYQPRVCVASGRLLGAEALARMRNQQGQLLDASQMINLAEESGRIADVTWRMIELVCRDLGEMRKRTSLSLRISFNVSASVLADESFAVELDRIVRQAGMRPQDFVLEITESRLPSDPVSTLELLTRLRIQGFELAIDDFGTGFSNIEHLRMFPFTELKIDKSFMLSARRDSFALACVEASVSLARELGLHIVAEGIETKDQLDLARRYGIDEAQGYLFSRPLPFRDFCDYAQQNAQTVGDAVLRKQSALGGS
jgi:EAL domain-containing protein (putative c-di-GMP-specific phosphodiesterase class I)/FixJ family two-component response regulator